MTNMNIIIKRFLAIFILISTVILPIYSGLEVKTEEALEKALSERLNTTIVITTTKPTTTKPTTTKPTTTKPTTTKPTTTKPTTTKPTTTESTTIESSHVTSSKYPYAAIVWNYLRDLGYSKTICAGILGNMMAEVGGNTLALQPKLYGGNYYGICQWYLGYYPDIAGADIYTQLDYLANTIKYEFNTFGYKYYSGFNYNAFLKITDSGDAAKAFAMCYERCASWTYSVRISNAYTAYDYFA